MSFFIYSVFLAQVYSPWAPVPVSLLDSSLRVSIPSNDYLLDLVHSDVCCGSPRQASGEVAGWAELELIKPSALSFQPGLLGAFLPGASSLVPNLVLPGNHLLTSPTTSIPGRQDLSPGFTDNEKIVTNNPQGPRVLH